MADETPQINTTQTGGDMTGIEAKLSEIEQILRQISGEISELKTSVDTALG